MITLLFFAHLVLFVSLVVLLVSTIVDYSRSNADVTVTGAALLMFYGSFAVIEGFALFGNV